MTRNKAIEKLKVVFVFFFNSTLYEMIPYLVIPCEEIPGYSGWPLVTEPSCPFPRWGVRTMLFLCWC